MRRGGGSQRLKRGRTEDGGHGGRPPASALALFLSSEVLWGSVSTQFAKKVAELAVQDIDVAISEGPGFFFPDLRGISTLPHNHMYQAFLKLVSTPMIPLSVFKLPMLLRGVMKRFDAQALWPHDYFSSLYHCYPSEWKSRILPDVGRIRSFWRRMRDHPLLDDHDILSRESWQSLCIPISIHGDGVPVTSIAKSWGKSMEVLSWASMLAHGSTLGTFNFIFGIYQSACSTSFGNNTMREFFLRLAWSLEALYEGEHPHRDWRGRRWPAGSEGDKKKGQPLCGPGAAKFFCLVMVMRGDLEWKFKTSSLRNYNENEQPCNSCRANASNRSWKVFTLDAAYIPTIWSSNSWRIAYPHPGCPLFEKRFISILAVVEDYMHTMPLGIYQYMLGSVLWLLAFVKMPSSPDENVQQISAALRTYWRINTTKGHYQNLKRSMFEGDPNGTPLLKGQAGEIKRIVKSLFDVWESWRSRSIVDQQISLMLRKFIVLDDLLDEHCPIEHPTLPRNKQEIFEKSCFDVLSCIQFINAHFARNPVHFEGNAKVLFNVTIKCHSLVHIALLSRKMNPRCGICYAGEDYMRFFKKIAQSSVRANNVVSCSNKVTNKIRTALHHSFSGQDWFRR